MLSAPQTRPLRSVARTRRLVAGFVAVLALPAALLSPVLSSSAAAALPPLAAVATAQSVTPTPGVPVTAKADVAALYRSVLVPALATPAGWSGGNVSTCGGGAPSAAGQQATLDAVNFYRNLVGLASVTFDPTLSSAAQQAALMMDAQNALSHQPDSSWKCYTPTGAAAAGKSDLYLGVTGASAIAGYMVDPGTNNPEAGHRRWILYPPETKMGSGSTSRANALYVVDQPSWNRSFAAPQWVAWPPAGYLPGQLEPAGRWSLSATDATTSFASATVTVTKNGVALPVTVNPIQPTAANELVGDPTLVWQVNPGYTLGGADQAYVVTVNNIKRGTQTLSYQYTTTLFDPNASQTITMPNPGPHQYGDAFYTQASASSGLPVTVTSLTPSVCSVVQTSVYLIGLGTCTLQATQPGNGSSPPAAPPVQQSFAVAKRSVTVVPSDVTTHPGAVPSTYAFGYNGLAPGVVAQSDPAMSGSPVCSSPATNASPNGSYVITCSQGTLASSYYTFSYAQATLKLVLGEIAVDPYRLLDTRGAGGAVGPFGQRRVAVIGQGGVPAGASAAVLNVTVTQPTVSGVITVYPTGTPTPTASNLNFLAGQTVPNSVIAPIGADGTVTLYNRSAGSVQLVVDVSGYFITGGAVTPGEFDPIGPTRLLDTRVSPGAVAAHGRIAMSVTGRAGIPAGVSAVAINVTVTQPQVAGYVTVYPSGRPTPTASNLNFVKGQTVPNLVIAPVGADGKVILFNNSGGSVQLVADVMGYFVGGQPTSSGTFGALDPVRLLDTRNGNGGRLGAVGPYQALAVQVTGRGGVPAGATAVVLNVTVTQPTVAGAVTAFPSGRPRPLASNLNFVKGQTVPNLVVAPVGADGKVMLYNYSGGTVQLVADVSGYFIG